MGSPPGKDRRNDASFRSNVSTALRIASTCTIVRLWAHPIGFPSNLADAHQAHQRQLSMGPAMRILARIPPIELMGL